MVFIFELFLLLYVESKYYIAEVGNIIAVLIINIVMPVFSGVFSVSMSLYTLFFTRLFT